MCATVLTKATMAEKKSYTMMRQRPHVSSSRLIVCLLVALLADAAAWAPPIHDNCCNHRHSPRRSPIVSPPSSSFSRSHSFSLPCRRHQATSIAPSTITTTTTTTALFGLLDFLTNPYDSKIPPELSDDIYQAEANTEAAKDRGTRIALYTLLAVMGIGLAVFNGFLTELRLHGLPPTEGNVAAMNHPLTTASPSGGDHNNNNLDILNQAGFGWVLQNPLYQFMFTNKIGGALCLLTGGGSALLAEAELDSKRINAEKIYEELERRRQLKGKTTSSKQQQQQQQQRKKRKKQSGKQKKSLKALSEVMVRDDETTPTVAPASPETPQEETPIGKDGEGIFGKVKDLYDKADSMAASQALLLNKKLEDAGVVDKITDETGLKVIGKEEAAKRLQQQQQQQQQQQEQSTEKEA